MELRSQRWCIALLLSVAAVSVAQAQDTGSKATLRSVHELMRAQRFDGALALLKKVPEKKGEVGVLEAEAWLGKALLADRDAVEAVNALHYTGIVKHTLASFSGPGSHPQQQEFAKAVEGQVQEYLRQSAPLAASWPGKFAAVMEAVDKARALAKAAYEREPAGSKWREEAEALWVWSEVYAYLASKDAQRATIRVQIAKLLPDAELEAIQKAYPKERQPQALEPQVQTALGKGVSEALERKSPTLALAMAEATLLYCAGADRLRGGPFAAAQQRFTSFSAPNRFNRLAQPPPGAPNAPAGPSPTDTAGRVKGQPESLILPLFQLAAQEGKKAPAAARYGLYLTQLAYAPEEARKLLTEMLAETPRSVALLLEKARLEAVLTEDPNAGRTAARETLNEAFQSGLLRRPVFGSWPAELLPLWLASRKLADVAPQFLFTYRQLASLPPPAGGVRPDPSLALIQQLQVSELLLTANNVSDVTDGIGMAEAALDRAQKLGRTAENSPPVKAIQRRLAEVTAQLPPTVAHPHLTFTQWEMQPDGSKRAVKTLYITPDGLAAFSRITPG